MGREFAVMKAQVKVFEAIKEQERVKAVMKEALTILHQTDQKGE